MTITIDIHMAPRCFEYMYNVVLVYYIAACSYTDEFQFEYQN